MQCTTNLQQEVRWLKRYVLASSPAAFERVGRVGVAYCKGRLQKHKRCQGLPPTSQHHTHPLMLS